MKAQDNPVSELWWCDVRNSKKWRATAERTQKAA